MQKYKGVIVCIAFIAMQISAFAQNTVFFSSDHDTSSSLFNKLLYDHNGFIWIATEDGLNRYDGSKFNIYKNVRGDSTSLAHNYVSDIFEDAEGHLWVSTYKGLQLYDPATDSFRTCAVNSGDNSRNYTSYRQMLQLKSGEIIGLGLHPSEIVIAEGNEFSIKSLSNRGEMVDAIAAIEDIDGSLWLAHEKPLLARVMPDGSVKRYLDQAGDPIISCFIIGRNDILYAGTQDDGLYRYDRINDKFESLGFNEFEKSFRIKDMLADESGRILLATDGTGLKAFKPRTGTFENIDLLLPNSDRLKVHTVVKDEYGNLWTGIFHKGIVMVPNKATFFQTISQRNYDKSLIGTACITSILRDRNNILWVGTDNDGLYTVNTQKGTSQHYSNDVPGVIMSLYEDQNGNLWIGSYDNGGGIFNKETGKMQSISLIDGNGVEARHVFGFTEDNDGYIWIATMGAGVFVYDPKTHKAEPLKGTGSHVNKWVTSATYSSTNECVYIGTYDGLYALDTNMTNLRLICPTIIVNDILLDDHDNTIWLATSAGIIHLNNFGNILNTYDVTSGLPSNAVYALQNDDSNLWGSTNSGLVRLNRENGDVTVYTVDDGLQSNEFYKKAAFKDQKGTLYFGGINGITYFTPHKIQNLKTKYDLRITDFYIGETPVRAGMKSGNRIITEKPVYDSKTFKLSHKDNSFSIEFSTKQFTHPSNLQFMYSFDGKTWEKIPYKRSSLNNGGMLLTFSNLESGRHKLRIKALDDGMESDPLELIIDIDPVWYLSWWAKTIWIILALAIIGLFTLHMQNRYKKKRKELEQKHKDDIYEAKLQFFTNISHEIRTPLTLVISPLQKLQTSDNDPSRQKTYRTILRNANRILRLVNELMDLRKIDNNQMKLIYKKMNLSGFIRDVYETFIPAATNKNIEISFNDNGCENLMAWIDTSNLDKIIMNLLSNALKYTGSGGRIDIKLSQGIDPECEGPLHNYAQITVTDTGIGIPVDARKHIFERFYTVGNNTAGGTGIGLHLTHSLVALHHGTIEVSDNPVAQGTCFTVRIPLGNEHLQSDEMITQTEAIRSVPNRPLLERTSELAIEVNDNEQISKKGGKSTKNVFVIEDDNDVRNYLIDNLSKEYNVTAFVNGAQAFEAICKEAPDLIITDVMMPEMDGMALTSKIKQNVNLNHVPIVMLTAKNREEDYIEGLNVGADVYMAKPFNIDILMKTVQKLIENRRLLRNVFSGSQNQEERVEDLEATSSDDKLMERVMKVINKHMSDADVTVEQIAEEIGISRVHLHRKLKELTNQTTRDFIRNIRLQQAAKLLREKRLSVAEVSYLVGFKHPNNFSTNFKEMFGMTPSAYCDMHQEGNSSSKTNDAN